MPSTRRPLMFADVLDAIARLEVCGAHASQGRIRKELRRVFCTRGKSAPATLGERICKAVQYGVMRGVLRRKANMVRLVHGPIAIQRIDKEAGRKRPSKRQKMKQQQLCRAVAPKEMAQQKEKMRKKKEEKLCKKNSWNLFVKSGEKEARDNFKRQEEEKKCRKKEEKKKQDEDCRDNDENDEDEDENEDDCNDENANDDPEDTVDLADSQGKIKDKPGDEQEDELSREFAHVKSKKHSHKSKERESKSTKHHKRKREKSHSKNRSQEETGNENKEPEQLDDFNPIVHFHNGNYQESSYTLPDTSNLRRSKRFKK